MKVEHAKVFLGYVEKEMTLLGICSAFSTGAIAFAVKILPEVKTAQWNGGYAFVGVGALLFLVATWFFFWQRSDLGWEYHGEVAIKIAEATGDQVHIDKKFLRAFTMSPLG